MNTEFKAGQSVLLPCAVWDGSSVKNVQMPAVIQHVLTFKQTAIIHYFDPFDGQPVRKEVSLTVLSHSKPH